MDPTVSSLAAGIGFVIVAGIMCGTYTLPMKYLGRWSWENVWAIFILVSCVVMPLVFSWLTIPGFVHVLGSTPPWALLAACGSGFAWGFGAIMFGQSISAIGISLSNTLVLAISASLGSFLPILILAPERLRQSQGGAIILGTLIGIVGIACCGYAGFLRQRSQNGSSENIRGEMVGEARPFAVGLLLCIGAGLLSAVFNIGYSLAQPIVATATKQGHSAFAGANLIWLLMLTSGAVPNLGFCGYLFKKNGSYGKYTLSKSGVLYILAVTMGLLWGGEIFIYGFATPKIGTLGPAIGWPLKLIAGLLAANVSGFLIGEWKLSRLKDRQWMALGLVVLLAAILTLGWSSTLQ